MRIGNLSVEICGEGPPVLLIHGFGATAFTWSKITPWLRRHHTVVTLDLKGFGRSEKPLPSSGYALRDQAAAVREIVDTLRLEDLTLVGHSMGGAVALLLAMELDRNAPGLLRRLVLVDSIACRQQLPLFIALLRMPVLGWLGAHLTPAALAVRIVLRLAYQDARRIEPVFVERYAASLREPGGRAALLATARALIPPDLDALTACYQKIRAPVLLLWGAQDRIVPLSVAECLEQLLPNCRREVIEDCGHIPHEEQPENTMKWLADFLGDPPDWANPPSG